MKKTVLIILFVILTLCTNCTAEPAGYGISPLAGTLFINEFMASNSATITDEHGDYDDWVELYNDGSAPINLGSMYLTDDLAKPMKWSFPDTSIAAHGYLLIWCDGETSEGLLHTQFKLNANPGEQLGLFIASGERLLVIDTLSYGVQRKDTSYGRIPDGGLNWQFLSNPTPRAKNITNLSEFNNTLFINEFMAANTMTIVDGFGDYDDWVELYNASSSPIYLGNMCLTDDLSNPRKWSFPDTTIPAHGFLLVWADNETGEGSLHAAFSLAAATGEQLGLYEKYSNFALIIDTISFGPQARDTSYGRLPDGGAAWQYFSNPTPQSSNHNKGWR